MAKSEDRRRHGPDLALVERRVALAPQPDSARRARRALRDALVASGRDQWIDDAELALSEVVTNATLHAHTDIEVCIEVFAEAVCVEVRDFNQTLPVQRNYGNEGTTGRGLGLLAALTLHCGVRSLGEAGKVVWFCVGDDRGDAAADDVIAALDVEKYDGDDRGLRRSREVVLAAMPTTLWLSAREHHDGMIRELGYYLAAHTGAECDIAAADQARSTISATLCAVLAEADAAGATRSVLPLGHPIGLPWVPENLDLAISVKANGASTFAALQDVLDLAESLAMEGKLLLAPGLPEIVAVRNWACEQVIAQLAGMQPTPWPGAAQQHFETEVRAQPMSAVGWDPATVTGADRPVVAADEANRIIAVSEPLADLLGWSSEDLVGRRVVTIVPPALREAHVAGFSRHLSTGVAQALGVPLQLPVLAADGREIPCSLFIERIPASAGHAVFVAWIERI